MRTFFYTLILLLVALTGFYFFISTPPEIDVTPVEVTEEVLQRGEYLLHAGGCISCHSKEDDENKTLSGGRALETPFGTFMTPNITPDRETGIGAWSDADFITAFRYGISPGGAHYFPAFPYTAYTGIRQEDLLALKAYLFSLPAVKQANQAHDLVWYVSFRPLLAFWKFLYFKPGEFEPDNSQSAEWNKGAYLVRHLGHCGECHTPRTPSGSLNDKLYLAGNPDGPEGDAVPNITPHDEDGIGKWSLGDIESFLEIGLLPDGDFAGASMVAVIDDNTAHLSAEDRKAIAVYLKSLPPLSKAGD